MPKLNQVIAVEKGIKTKTNERVTEVYKRIQHAQLFSGFNKQYKPMSDDGERFPPESLRVQANGREVVAAVAGELATLFDVTAQKDFANCEAKGDVIVDGQTLLSGVPATYLLFLEKQLVDFHTLVEKIPTLDPGEDWRWDDGIQLFRTEPTQTMKTKKIQKAIVLYQATDKHPAQTQLVTEDAVVGTWDQTKYSGAMTVPAKDALVRRIERLQQAVKFAREAANSVDAPARSIGEKVFSWLTEGQK